MSKLHIDEVLVVEGKMDKQLLEQYIDGDIITIANLMPRYDGEWTITSINMKTMEWMRDPESETEKPVVFERAKN